MQMIDFACDVMCGKGRRTEGGTQKNGLSVLCPPGSENGTEGLKEGMGMRMKSTLVERDLESGHCHP